MQGVVRDLCHGPWGVSPVDGKYGSRYAGRRYNDGINGKPCAGFGVDFYREKACRRLKKFLRDNSLFAAGAQVKACKGLLRLQGVRSKLSYNSVLLGKVLKCSK